MLWHSEVSMRRVTRKTFTADINFDVCSRVSCSDERRHGGSLAERMVRRKSFFLRHFPSDHLVCRAAVDEGMSRELSATCRTNEYTIFLIILTAEISNDALDIALYQRAIAALFVLEETRRAFAHYIHTPFRQLLAWRCHHSNLACHMPRWPYSANIWHLFKPAALHRRGKRRNLSMATEPTPHAA